MRKSIVKFSLFASIILISIHGQARAQIADTTWFDSDWEVSTIDHAEYYSVQAKTAWGRITEDHYRNGMLIRSHSYYTDSLGDKRCVARTFDEHGGVTRMTAYDGEFASGPDAEYWENGRIRLQGNNLYDRREGTWFAYFKSGKLAGKAEFHAGKQTALTIYCEDGSLNNQDTIFNRDAEFPGGVAQYQRFFNKSYRYPDSAGSYGIGGTVVVDFKVLKDGKIDDIHVVKSINKDLDDEALRVLKLMPNWKPAILAGVPYDSELRQPVVFHL